MDGEKSHDKWMLRKNYGTFTLSMSLAGCTTYGVLTVNSFAQFSNYVDY